MPVSRREPPSLHRSLSEGEQAAVCKLVRVAGLARRGRGPRDPGLRWFYAGAEYVAREISRNQEGRMAVINRQPIDANISALCQQSGGFRPPFESLVPDVQNCSSRGETASNTGEDDPNGRTSVCRPRRRGAYLGG